MWIELITVDSRLKPNPLASVVQAAPQESPVFVVMSSYPISPSRRSSSGGSSHEEGCPISLSRWTLRSGIGVSLNYQLIPSLHLLTKRSNWAVESHLGVVGRGGGGGVLVSAIRREIVFLFSILFVAPLKLTAHGVANHIADKLGWRMFACCGKPSKNILNRGKPSKTFKLFTPNGQCFDQKLIINLWLGDYQKPVG